MVRNKHKFLIAVAGVVFFVCVIAFLFIKSSMNTKTFDDFIGNPSPDISKITMRMEVLEGVCSLLINLK